MATRRAKVLRELWQSAVAEMSEATAARYDAVQKALDAAGATLEAPGALTRKIRATLAQGDELARVLEAEIKHLAAARELSG